MELGPKTVQIVPRIPRRIRGNPTGKSPPPRPESGVAHESWLGGQAGAVIAMQKNTKDGKAKQAAKGKSKPQMISL